MKTTKASHHLSPLRYPGGKGKLSTTIKQILKRNDLLDCTYIEPFAGGAGVALSLLFHGYVQRVIINDLSLPIYAFWLAVTQEHEEFIERISTVELSVAEWVRQRQVFRTSSVPDFELGFAAFFLNRTNHSGVLNGGIIGGVNQSSRYGIDARFNRGELAARVKRLARFRDGIEVHNRDAGDLIRTLPKLCDASHALMYADPPYVQKGPDLYYSHYKTSDHSALRDAICDAPKDLRWCVSYDNHQIIRDLYSNYRSFVYDLSYSVRNGRVGREVMFFSDNIDPNVPGFAELGASSDWDQLADSIA